MALAGGPAATRSWTSRSGCSRTRGYHGVSMDDIGAAAGVTGPALYHHFAGKEAMLVAALIPVSEGLLTGGMTRVAEHPDDPRGLLDSLVDFHVEFALDNPAVIALHLHELDRLPEEPRRTIRRLQRLYVEVWVQTLLALRPDLTDEEARVLAHAAFGLMNSTPFLGGEVDRDRRAALLRRRDALGHPGLSRPGVDAIRANLHASGYLTIVHHVGGDLSMIGSLLVANRGEIARRIIRTAKRLGIRTIAVYSEADAGMPFVLEADEAVLIGPANPALSYRNTEAILAAAKATGAEAIHPGYGFLSENADFARTVAEHGLIWVGPSADAITAMGDKINARNLMAAAGVPVAPGTDRSGRHRRGRDRRGATGSVTRSWSRRRPAAAAWAWRAPPTRTRCGPSTTRSGRSPSGCSATGRC